MSIRNGRIAVAGATGRVGRHVVRALARERIETTSISRSHGCDLISGEGLAGALAGATAIIDAATGESPDQTEATAFFTQAAANLHREGVEAGVKRILSISIIGTDAFTAGYGVAKQRHEEAILGGPIQARVVRASQFHEFIPLLVAWGRQGDVSSLQKTRTQPIAARSLAETLVEIVTADWSTSPEPIMEVAGPREEDLAALAKLWVEKTDQPVTIETVSKQDDPDFHLHESGALLPGANARLVGPTFEEWLQSDDVGTVDSHA